MYYPSTQLSVIDALALIAGLLQYHSQATEAHRVFNTALYDQFIANLGGSHKLSFAFGGNVKIDCEQLFLILLRAEVLVVLLERLDIVSKTGSCRW